jgi:hypothetical protein
VRSLLCHLDGDDDDGGDDDEMNKSDKFRNSQLSLSFLANHAMWVDFLNRLGSNCDWGMLTHETL